MVVIGIVPNFFYSKKKIKNIYYWKVFFSLKGLFSLFLILKKQVKKILIYDASAEE